MLDYPWSEFSLFLFHCFSLCLLSFCLFDFLSLYLFWLLFHILTLWMEILVFNLVFSFLFVWSFTFFLNNVIFFRTIALLCSLLLLIASKILNGLSTFLGCFFFVSFIYCLWWGRRARHFSRCHQHTNLDTGEILWLTSSSGLNALIFHAVQGLLCNLQAQHFSGQYLNYVPAGHSLIRAGSSRFHEKK